MGSFEDKIKSKFENASVAFNAETWEAVDQKLDQGQMGDLLFSQKVANAFHFTVIPYSPLHWNSIQSSLNELELENSFKNKFENAVYSGPVLGWDKMSQKINDSQLGGFESAVKNKLSSAQITYKDSHWDALLHKMVWKDRFKIIKVSAAVLVAGLGALLLFNTNEKLEGAQTRKNDSFSATEQMIHIGGVNVDKSEELLVGSERVSEIDVKEINASESDLLVVANKSSGPESSVIVIDKSLKINDKQGLTGKKVSRKQGSNQEDEINEFKGELFAASSSNSVGSVNIAEQELANLTLSFPVLAKTSTDVALLKEKESFFHIGLAPIFAFWDNSSVTGMYGAQQFSFCGDQEWVSYRQDGEEIAFEWKEPVVLKGGYEYSLKNSGFSIGTYVNNKRTENWNFSELSLTGSYEMNLENSIVRFGAGANYTSNKLQTSGLSLREQFSSGEEVYTRERNIGSLDVQAEELLKFNIGAILLSKYYLLSYSLNTPALVKVNHDSPTLLNQRLTIGGNLPFYKLKLTALFTVDRSDKNYYTPGVAASYAEHWFSAVEYQNMERFNFNIGRQFDNGFRAFVTYGSVASTSVENLSRDVFSNKGHLGLGLNYVIK